MFPTISNAQTCKYCFAINPMCTHSINDTKISVRGQSKNRSERLEKSCKIERNFVEYSRNLVKNKGRNGGHGIYSTQHY